MATDDQLSHYNDIKKAAPSHGIIVIVKVIPVFVQSLHACLRHGDSVVFFSSSSSTSDSLNPTWYQLLAHALTISQIPKRYDRRGASQAISLCNNVVRAHTQRHGVVYIIIVLQTELFF